MKTYRTAPISTFSFGNTHMRGFTIVELLIVIVVIAILAAITIVAFNGVQQRARVSSLSSSLETVSKKMMLYQVDNPNTYPAALSAVDILDTTDVKYQHRLTSTGYCTTATSGKLSYMITESTDPTAGACVGHSNGGVALTQNLVPNPSFETNTTGWSVVTGATMTRVTSGPGIVVGNAALELSITGTNASGTNMGITGLMGSSVYTASVYITAISGDFTNLNMRTYDAGGSRATQTFSPILTAGQTVRKTLTWTSNASPGTSGINIQRSGTASGSAVIRIDAVMIEQGATATAYSE